MQDEEYLYRHGFFDENILALKLDGKEGYAILINESKYGKMLNSIEAVIKFLNKKYVLVENEVETVMQIGDGYTFRMGSYNVYSVRLKNGKIFFMYEKKSNGKYFIHVNEEIYLFPGKQACLKYIQNLEISTD